jgi:hypothetical protein
MTENPSSTRFPVRHGFGVGLVLLLVTIVCFALTDRSRWMAAVVVTIEGLTLLTLLAAAAMPARRMRWAAGFVGVCVVAVWLGAVLGRDGGWTIPAVGAAMVLIAPSSILRSLRRRTTIDAEMVYGALCLYLLAGLFYASVYGIIDGASTPPFFGQIDQARAVDFVYFSFVTLATLGYGDLTPRGDLGRMLAVTETLIGQLYLVGAVAIIVSNLGKTRTPRERN